MFTQPLISAADAKALSAEPDLKFVDATWFLPNLPTRGYDAYALEHIPGAVFFDIDAIADTSIKLPHVFPSLEIFEQSMGELGISEHDRVIVYDRGNFVASARAWWMFSAFGHQQVSTLDGGLPAWKKIGGDVSEDAPDVAPAVYQGTAAKGTVVTHGEVVSALSDQSQAIIDARSQGRFSGAEPEPRPGLRGGHIPGSQNMYYGDLLNGDGTMKGADAIAAHLESLSISADQQIISTCGSGVTAAILLLGISQVRQDGLKLYDGSWTEWALNPASPI